MTVRGASAQVVLHITQIAASIQGKSAQSLTKVSEESIEC